MEILVVLDWVPDWVITNFLTFVATLVATLVVVLVKNRRSLLTYHVRHDRIGISTYDNIHGEVSVTVGGNQMQNLYMSNVWLVNRSMRDVENLEIKIYAGTDDLKLMSEQTHIEGTVDFLKYTAEYEGIKSQLLNAVAEKENAMVVDDATENKINQTQASNWKMWSSQRWYKVPVFARGQTIKFTYMTNVLSDVDPVIHISCQKAGIRVKYKQPYQPIWHLWGVPLVQAGLAGIVIGVFVWFVIISSISTLWLAALLCLVAGLLGNIPGAAMVKSCKWCWDRLIG